MKTALVLGAGGFIGSHLVKRLKSEGYWVRGVDIKFPEFSKSDADEFLIFDLRDYKNVESIMRFDGIEFSYYQRPFSNIKPFDEVYQLAADMGGAGYVFTGEHDADIMSNSAIININVCHWAKEYGVKKIFYSSSACMYPQERQNENFYRDEELMLQENDFSLKESDAYPANPDSEYGWEKLFSERLYLAYQRNYNLNVRIARFHNIYGPEGTYKGGKEKAPAAMCRKVIEGNTHIDIWGNGKQTRSFLYIDDCIDAIRLLMESDFKEPINIGSEEMVSIMHLANMAVSFNDTVLTVKCIDGPTGVHGRNSNNDLIRKVLNWEPKFKLIDGMILTYKWIASQYE